MRRYMRPWRIFPQHLVSYPSDSPYEPAKRAQEEFDRLHLPKLPDVREEFEELCRKEGV